VDETYLNVRGRWAYFYRAIDRDGTLVDTMLSEHRDMAAAKAFFRSAKAATGVLPERVTTVVLTRGTGPAGAQVFRAL
jgi:transposase-like protein